jgi:soluble lytic murein transglycosylase-like protein
MRSIILFFLLYVTVNNTFAESCWQSAENRYGIHETILHAISLTESAMDSQAINHNINGSVDIGLMQINSRWFPYLAEIRIQPGDLWNPCTNINVGAWVLAGEVRRFGYTWQAVGAYHAGPAKSVVREQRRMRYAQRVYHNLLNDNPHFSNGVRIYARTKQ